MITTPAQTLTAGVTSGPITIQLEDQYSNFANAGSDQTISLTSSSTAPFGVNFRDMTDTTNITTVTMSAGTSTASFRYNDTLAGSPLLTAADSPLTSGTQIEAVNAAAATKLVFTTAPQALTAGVTSGPITVQLDDPFNNVATATSTQTVLLTTSSTAPFGVNFRNSADTINITTVTISTGASSASFKYNDTLAGSPLLTVADAPLTSATQTETVSAAAASKLVITTVPQALIAGVTSSAVTVQLDDPFNNVATATTTQTVLLTTSSTAPFGVHFRDVGDTANIASVTISAGASNASFKYNDTLVGNPLLTAADSPLTSVTQTETVSAAAASKLVITTAPQALTAGVTSGPITVQLDDPFNNVATATSTQTVQLTTSSTAAFGVHFRDTADTADISSVTIGAGTSSASFKYKDTLAGNPLLTATDNPLTSVSQTENVSAAAASKLVITTAPQTLTAGVVSSPITVQLDDPFNNVATAVSTQTVLLTTSSTAPFGVHFRDTADITNITSVTINIGGSNASFKYTDTLAGTPLLTAADSPLTSATQTETVNAAAASKLVITTAPQLLTAGTTSGPITVQLDDPFNNAATASTTQTVLLTTSSTAPFGVHFRDTADTANITSVTINAGTSTASFKYNDTLAGSPLLTVADSPLTSVSQSETVSAAAASKLVLTTAPQTLTAGVTSGPITVQLDDPFNNVALAASTQTVQLTTSSTAPFGVNFRNTADTANITSVTINTGASSASFKYNDTLAGSPLLTAADSPLSSATQTETVNATAASKLVITTAAQTLTAGVTSGPITVQLQDPFNNVATMASTQTVQLTTSSTAAFGVHFRDVADTINITSVTIGTGTSSASFKYNDTLAGSPLLTAADSPLTSTTQTETVGAAAASKLVITTAPQTLTAGVTSNIIRVQLDDPFNNVATAAGTQTVLLTTSSTAPFGVHFRDAADTINITSVTISTGASSATFKYNDTLSGSPLLTVADSPLTSATQTETVSAAAASKLVIATLAQTLTAGVTSNTMTVQLDDPFNNVATAASTQTVLLTTSSTAPFGVHFRDTADTTNITSVTISTGASSASFKYNDTLAGSPLLTAADSPLTSATQTETVGAAAAIKLVLTTAPQTLTAGVTSGVITVQLDDPFNNVATAASTQTVLLTTSSTAPFGVHFRDTADTTNITSVAIGTGASSASFKYNDTLSGSPLLTVADAPLTSASQSETVNAAGASKLVITTGAQTLTAGVTSSLMTVQLDDSFSNVTSTASTQTVLLTTSSTAPFGVHFRDTADTTNITSVTIGAGASSASFKYNDTLAGSVVLTAADSPLTSATQSETVNAAAASKLVITTAAQTLTAGVTSNTITVQLDDPFNNAATAASTQTVNLTTTSSGQFRDNATGNTPITSVTISTGEVAPASSTTIRWPAARC